MKRHFLNEIWLFTWSEGLPRCEALGALKVFKAYKLWLQSLKVGLNLCFDFKWKLSHKKRKKFTKCLSISWGLLIKISPLWPNSTRISLDVPFAQQSNCFEASYSSSHFTVKRRNVTTKLLSFQFQTLKIWAAFEWALPSFPFLLVRFVIILM